MTNTHELLQVIFLDSCAKHLGRLKTAAARLAGMGWWHCGKCTKLAKCWTQSARQIAQWNQHPTFPVQLLTMINGLSACAAAVHMLPLLPLHAWARNHHGRTCVPLCASGSVLAVTGAGRLPRDAAMQVRSTPLLPSYLNTGIAQAGRSMRAWMSAGEDSRVQKGGRQDSCTWVITPS